MGADHQEGGRDGELMMAGASRLILREALRQRKMTCSRRHGLRRLPGPSALTFRELWSNRRWRSGGGKGRRGCQGYGEGIDMPTEVERAPPVERIGPIQAPQNFVAGLALIALCTFAIWATSDLPQG